MSVDLSILMVSHGHGADLRKCLASLAPGLEGLSYETIIVDNLSEPDFRAQIGEDIHGLTLISNAEVMGFGANVNQAARAACGRVLLVLNPDTVYRAGQIADAVQFLEADARRGVLAASLYYPDGTIQRNFRGFPSLAVTFLRAAGANDWDNAPGFYKRAMLDDLHPDAPTAVDWVFGAFMLIRKAHFDEMGGFDESFFMYYEDVDLCYRLRTQGLTTWIYPGLSFVHEHKRDSTSALGKLQFRHLSSLLRYAWKDNALITPPTFGPPAAPPSSRPPALDPAPQHIADPGLGAACALALAHVAGAVMAAVLAGWLVSWLPGAALGAPVVTQTAIWFSVIFVFSQFILMEYEASGLGDAKRRVVGGLESAIITLFPCLVLLLPHYFAMSGGQLFAFALVFALLVLVAVTVATLLVSTALTSAGRRIALITDTEIAAEQYIPALPIGRQSVAITCQMDPDRLDALEEEIGKAIRDRGIDQIYFFTSPARDADLLSVVRRLSMFDVLIWHALRDADTAKHHEVLRLRSPLRSRAREAMKRGLDIAVCLAALAVFVVPLLIVALLIYLEDPGPVFFGQTREGRNGVPFKMLKFRSMYHKQSDAAANQLTTKNDARITKIGAFIRRTSVDELPQILNVLRGEMSIVGPRPLPVGFHFKGYKFEDETPYWNWRHRVAPGITGLSQLKGLRGTPDTLEEAQEMMLNRCEFDNLYIDNWSIWQDLKIIFMTGLSGAFAAKAY